MRVTMVVSADQAARINNLLRDRNNGDAFVPMDAEVDESGRVTKAATRYWCSWDPDAYDTPGNPVRSKLTNGRLDLVGLLRDEAKQTVTRDADIDPRRTLVVAENVDPERVRARYEQRLAAETEGRRR